MTSAPAHAKINLGLVAGPLRADDKHEIVTVLQRVGLHDEIALRPAQDTHVEGFSDDTIVRAALDALAAEAGVDTGWRVRIEKRIPVAAGLGGGSSDAATALRLANATLDDPLPPARLHELAAALGADVPFFLADGPQLGEGDGAELTPLELPQDYVVLLVHPRDAVKRSTAEVYDAFDARDGVAGWDERRDALRDALAHVRRARDLAALPPNDLASSPLADELRGLGAFRADVTGAGPVVYGLFGRRGDAESAQRSVRRRGRTWVTEPAWYG
jgi:4-diphosphocytidyl-2-C-methyl-D-erythritol kinase